MLPSCLTCGLGGAISLLSTTGPFRITGTKFDTNYGFNGGAVYMASSTLVLIDHGRLALAFQISLMGWS